MLAALSLRVVGCPPIDSFGTSNMPDSTSVEGFGVTGLSSTACTEVAFYCLLRLMNGSSVVVVTVILFYRFMIYSIHLFKQQKMNLLSFG